MKIAKILAASGVVALSIIGFTSVAKAQDVTINFTESVGESAIRGAYSELRANGSAYAAAFEHTLPAGLYFESTNATDTTLTVVITNPGLDTSTIASMNVNAIASDTITFDTVEAATARAIDSLAATTPAEAIEIIGIVRAFQGTNSADGTSVTLE